MYPIRVKFMKSAQVAKETSLSNEANGAQLFFNGGGDRGEIYENSVIPSLSYREL